MISQKELEAEIVAVIDHQIDTHGKAIADWVMREVIGSKVEAQGDDSDWYKLCAFGHVRSTVRKVIQKYHPSGNQLTFKGFEYLQRVYSIDRNGESCAIRTELMTEIEMRAKAEQQRKMGEGCFKHAEEIDRFADDKWGNVNTG